MRHNNSKLIKTEDFTPEELRRWQMKLLEILVYFRDFCIEHNLHFVLSAGTSIGAVRHHGFIPWDDDVDVTLFREDYEKLIEIWNKEADTSRFVCSVTTKNQSSRFPMATIRSVDTTCIYDHSVNDDICQGLKIDVEFLDVVPKSFIGDKINKYFSFLMGMLDAERIPGRSSNFRKFASAFVYFILPSHKIRWYVSRLCKRIVTRCNPGGKDDRVRYFGGAAHLVSDLDEAIWVDFEGYKMPVPKGYDRILTKGFGDYMQFPPEAKRKPATCNLVFYDLDHSYKEYKGKYYCVNK
jgi:lipopolysaccharide cholinephosphotransferase